MTNVRITGFEMIEQVGVGGMGSTVWKARQISLDRIVAVKILSVRTAREADVKMFHGEAQSAAKLKHQGIVQVYDANAEGGVYYFVMEFIAGYTVESWLKRKGVLPENDALLVAEAVASALEYAWDKARIIHCDIKPGNVMIDEDGTVKVVDLGLSRSISAIRDQDDSDEIMGTPAYISPEQALGEQELDFRADMYSLGAMLYHLVTGKLMFAGIPEEKIMELQVTGTVPDVIDMGVKVSDGVAWLIEKLLAKKREGRYQSWQEARKDIVRIKSGLPLHGHLLAAGESTMERSPNRRGMIIGRGMSSRRSAGTAQGDRPSPVKMVVAAVVILALIAAGAGGFWWMKQNAKKETANVAKGVIDQPSETKPDQSIEKSRDEVAWKEFDIIKTWIAQNPDNYQENVAKLNDFTKRFGDTRYSVMAEEEIKRLGRERQKQADAVMSDLDKQAQQLAQNGEYIKAAEVYEAYSGRLSMHISNARNAKAGELRERQKNKEAADVKKKEQAEDKLKSVLDGVIEEFEAVGAEGAISFLDRSLSDPLIAGKAEDLRKVMGLLKDAAKMNDVILDSFRKQREQEVAVMLNSGKKNLVIKSVDNNVVRAEEKRKIGGGAFGVTTIPVSFGINDLAQKERLVRMGADDRPEVALTKGFMALDSKAYDYAGKYFSTVGTILSDRLVVYVENKGHQVAGNEAEGALALILASAGISIGQYNHDEWLNAVRGREFSEEEKGMISPAVKNFRDKYGKTKFAGDADDILCALEEVVPGQSNEEGEVQSGDYKQADVVLTPDIVKIMDDVKAVSSMLMAKNPRLDLRSVVITTDSQGKAREMVVRSADVVDISPVAALSTLKVFSYENWESRQGMLKDISPLRGLALESVTFRNCKVYDIMPLKGMPLKKVDLAYSGVKLLTPLKGSSVEYLDLSGTKVFSFVPLEGLPIKHLVLNDTQVKDVSFLRGMPLTHLELKNVKAYDFVCLQGMKLTYLDLEGTQIKSVDVLTGMPLKTLNCKKINVTNYAPLYGAPIEVLWIDSPASQSMFIKSLTKLHNLNGNNI